MIDPGLKKQAEDFHKLQQIHDEMFYSSHPTIVRQLIKMHRSVHISPGTAWRVVRMITQLYTTLKAFGHDHNQKNSRYSGDKK